MLLLVVAAVETFINPPKPLSNKRMKNLHFSSTMSVDSDCHVTSEELTRDKCFGTDGDA